MFPCIAVNLRYDKKTPSNKCRRKYPVNGPRAVSLIGQARRLSLSVTALP
jgi:hypothetical protein